MAETWSFLIQCVYRRNLSDCYVELDQLLQVGTTAKRQDSQVAF